MYTFGQHYYDSNYFYTVDDENIATFVNAISASANGTEYEETAYHFTQAAYAVCA